ncbi:hypothetical protein M446_1758 [Methylobacterium sp. 4-46]|uniref:hypothetical protein n=1 Tax=unclassified Methylobacterium TaxID=2615210 RepID=UPI000152D868|nr:MULTISPECIES: hypothetical protein [Methylobacterium]ACA16248.1 hypothetical protein M446_1758 [Methylobacterium sp. 4-46]WFT81955.1 hypothetical protein QA634_08885 [Methylobacterium nodulans]
MSGYWFCETPQGEFRIALTRWAGRDRVVLFYEREPLGCYDSAELALDRLIHGETYTPSCGLDLRHLPLPTTLSDWVFAADAKTCAKT